MRDLFYYQREVVRRVPTGEEKDGKPVMRDEKGVVWDCFNLCLVVRGYWKTDDTFIVMLHDGHEQAENSQVPSYGKDGKIKGVEIKRERNWYTSQIEMNKEDGERLFNVAGLGNNHLHATMTQAPSLADIVKSPSVQNY